MQFTRSIDVNRESVLSFWFFVLGFGFFGFEFLVSSLSQLLVRARVDADYKPDNSNQNRKLETQNQKLKTQNQKLKTKNYYEVTSLLRPQRIHRRN